MKKRIISIILLAIMALTLAACTKDGKDGRVTTNATAGLNTPGSTEDRFVGIAPNDYGLTFNVLCPDWANYKYYFFVEESSGEAMEQALFNREIAIEDHLGVDITYEQIAHSGSGIEDIYPELQQMSMTGDDLYQLVLAHCIQDTAVMITDGLLEDFNEIDTIDLDNPWWNHKSNENLSVNGKQFYAISDYNIPDVEVMLFNKKMIEENQLENPYDLVREGKWTVDKLMEMSAEITFENGDGIWDHNDTYGFGAASAHMLTGFTYSFGLTLVEQDDEGYFAFAMNSPRVYDVIEKFQALLSSPDTYVFSWTLESVGHAKYNPAEALNIESGRSLFSTRYLSALGDIRDTKVEFGILPYPKFDEAQEDYITVDWSGLMAVPLMADNKDMIGEVIELFGALSQEEVLPAFYDVMLGEKLSRDSDSREMLDIIFDSRLYDAGMNYFGFHDNMKKFWNIGDAISTGDLTGYSSFLGKYEDAAIAEIDEFNAALDD